MGRKRNIPRFTLRYQTNFPVRYTEEEIKEEKKFSMFHLKSLENFFSSCVGEDIWWNESRWVADDIGKEKTLRISFFEKNADKKKRGKFYSDFKRSA